jgi:hypothetical protein
MNSALSCIDSFPELRKIKNRPKRSDKLAIRCIFAEESHIIALISHMYNPSSISPKYIIPSEMNSPWYISRTHRIDVPHEIQYSSQIFFRCAELPIHSDTQGFRYSAEDCQIHQPLFSDSETHKQCFVCDKFPSSDLSQVVFVLQTAVELGYPLERTDLWVDPMWIR